MVWYKSKNTSYQYPKQTKYIYIYIYSFVYWKKEKKKKNQKLKVGKMLYTFYRHTCTILISYVEKLKKKCAKWLLGFFSNCDVFNYGSKISFLKISIDN